MGIGIVLQVPGLILLETGNTAATFGLFLILISIPVFIWGCMNYAEGKGHSKRVGLVGLTGLIGLIVLAVLPDQQKDANSLHEKRFYKIGYRAPVILIPLMVFGGLLAATLDSYYHGNYMAIGGIIFIVSAVLLVGIYLIILIFPR